VRLKWQLSPTFIAYVAYFIIIIILHSFFIFIIVYNTIIKQQMNPQGSHIRSRSPNIADREKYSKSTPAELKAKYNMVYEEFARCVNPGARLPEHYDKRGFTNSPLPTVPLVSLIQRLHGMHQPSEDTVKSQLIHEIINMEASIREMTGAKRAAADAAAADAAAAAAADAAAADTQHKSKYSPSQLIYRHEARDLQAQRARNTVSGYGPMTDEELKRYLSSRHIVDNKKNRGGRTKRAKKAKRSHRRRHRHFKQRCRTRKH
jgi:hypothetical protein